MRKILNRGAKRRFVASNNRLAVSAIAVRSVDWSRLRIVVFWRSRLTVTSASCSTPRSGRRTSRTRCSAIFRSRSGTGSRDRRRGRGLHHVDADQCCSSTWIRTASIDFKLDASNATPTGNPGLESRCAKASRC